MTTELRVIGADDWRLLRDVRLRALADAPTAFGATLGQAERLTDDEWRSRAGNGSRTLVAVAVEDDEGVAMGGAFAPDDRATVFVWGMWTAPAARRRGLSGRILDDLVAWCRARDEEVRLHVTEGNEGARRFYVGRGFEPTGAWEPLREGSLLRIEELALRL